MQDERTERLFQVHKDICEKAREILISKNHDYRGGGGDPYANFSGTSAFGVDPIVGILIRMQDKMMRIMTFASKGELLVKGETIDDAIVDIVNYSVIIKGFIEDRRRK